MRKLYDCSICNWQVCSGNVKAFRNYANGVAQMCGRRFYQSGHTGVPKAGAEKSCLLITSGISRKRGG